jgi:hypothetical protein
LIDAEYTAHPFYGTRKMVVILCNQGHKVKVDPLVKTKDS